MANTPKLPFSSLGLLNPPSKRRPRGSMTQFDITVSNDEVMRSHYSFLERESALDSSLLTRSRYVLRPDFQP